MGCEGGRDSLSVVKERGCTEEEGIQDMGPDVGGGEGEDRVCCAVGGREEEEDKFSSECEVARAGQKGRL